MLLMTSFVIWSTPELARSASAKSNNKDTGGELRDLAVLIHNRVVGVPAQGEILQEMIALLREGKAQEAALLATEHPFFYDFKLRALFTPWSNREGSVSAPLNDMVATMIGIVRDDLPFNEVLSGDVVYDRADDHESPPPPSPPDPTWGITIGRDDSRYNYAVQEQETYQNDFKKYQASGKLDALSNSSAYKSSHEAYTKAYSEYIEALQPIRQEHQQNDGSLDNTTSEYRKYEQAHNEVYQKYRALKKNHEAATNAYNEWQSAYQERYTQPGYTFADPSTSYKHYLKRFNQSEHTHKDTTMQGAISGVLSTNAFAESFYSAGTNRRATAFVLKNFLCHDIEQLHDTSTPKNWVRQDVDRSPGGDPNLFNEKCVGCHAGMDALSGWSTYYDFNRQLIYTEGKVQVKVGRNFFSDQGRVYGKGLYPGNEVRLIPGLPEHANNKFKNLWTEGPNVSLGWRGESSGQGAKEFGEMITRSKAFSSCMARHVYKSVCYLDPEEESAKTKYKQLAEQFEKDNYNMRKLFATTAVSCLTKEEESAGSGGEE